MANRWIKHLQQFRKKNTDLKPQEVMKAARRSYQSGGGASGDVTPYQPTNLASTASNLQGGRRRSKRRSSLSRRSSRTRRR